MQVEANEFRVNEMCPLCSICRFDLRNQSFHVHTLDCGHLFHEKCTQTNLRGNSRQRCPNCNSRQYWNAGQRAHFMYA